MLLIDQEKNEPHHFFEALFEAEMWNHIAHKTNRYAKKKRIHKDASKNKYLLFYIVLYFQHAA